MPLPPPRPAAFQHLLSLWSTLPEGEPTTLHASHLLSVRRQGRVAMLKVALDVAGQVFAHDGDAVLGLAHLAAAERDRTACCA